MKNIKHKAIGFLLFLVISFVNINAQIRESYFADFNFKHGGKAHSSIKYEDKVIVGTQSFDAVKYNPNLICFDTSGKVVWQTITKDTSDYSSNNGDVYVYLLTLATDGYLYTAYRNSNGDNELWKIDPKNGDITWKKNLPKVYPGNSAAVFIEFLTDYDSTRLIYTYRTGTNRRNHGVSLVSINKVDGSIASNAVLIDSYLPEQSYFTVVDSNKNLIHSIDNKIVKLDGIDTSKVLWNKTYTSTNIGGFDRGLFDSSGTHLFIFGNQRGIINRGGYMKINPSNGNLIFSKIANPSLAYDGTVSDALIKDDVLYITWRYITTGGNQKRFYATKYDIAKDSLIWDRYHRFSYTGMQAALSMDLDDSNDIYLSGYVGALNFGPSTGAWITIKLDGVNGDTIYHKLITNGFSTIDERSEGIGVHVINNKPYFVGTIQTSPRKNEERQTISFANLNSNTGSTIFKKDHYGSYQFRSAALSIQKYQNNKALVLKQVGEQIKVELYDSTKKLSWEKDLKSETHQLLGKVLKVSSSNNIYVAVSAILNSNYSQLYNSPPTDSLFVYKLDSTGKLLNQYSINIANTKSFPGEIHVKNDSLFFFYSNNGSLFHAKFQPTYFVKNTFIDYPDNLSETKIILDVSPDKFFYFGSSRILEIDKSDLRGNIIFSLPNAIRFPNYVTQTDSNLFLICGKSNSGDEAVALFNSSSKTLVWSKNYSTNKQSMALKGVTNPTNNYYYTISKNSTDIVVRKIDVFNGNAEWTYTYNSVGSFEDYPIDISYDEVNNNIVVTGYEGKQKGTKAIFFLLDTLGNAISTFSKDGDFVGENAGRCTYVWPDGTKWIGGNLNKNPYGPAGFIWSDEICVADTSSLIASGCSAYTSPSGKNTWSTSGIYYDTLTNTSGCDSVVKINLTINTPSFDTINPSTCDSFVSPSSKYTWNTSGTYYDTLANSGGCDSIITIKLTVNTPSSSTLNATECVSYTSPSGKYIWNASGVYYDTLTNTSSCDSVIKFNLTINTPSFNTISPTTCNTFSSPSGKYTWNTSGTYYDTLANSNGCDSIITINLTVGTFSTSTISETGCGSYTSPSRKNVWTSGGTYYDTLINTGGCDSIITINLTINTVNTNVTNTNNTLSANLSGASYQWINCNGNSLISGATQQSFIPAANGSYAVIVTDNSCSDTSTCFSIINLRVSEAIAEKIVKVFPNPSEGVYTLTSSIAFNKASINVYNAAGQLVISENNISSNNYILDLTRFSDGIYYVEVTDNSSIRKRLKLIKY